MFLYSVTGVGDLRIGRTEESYISCSDKERRTGPGLRRVMKEVYGRRLKSSQDLCVVGFRKDDELVELTEGGDGVEVVDICLRSDVRVRVDLSLFWVPGQDPLSGPSQMRGSLH